MTKDYLHELVETGREIEFIFEGKKYSITYGFINGELVMSFCEFNKPSTEVTSFNDLCSLERNSHTLLEMRNMISEEDVWIY